MQIRTAVARSAGLVLALTVVGSTFADASAAAVYTVGPGGTHPTISTALQAASSPGFDEIRVHTGVYSEWFSLVVIQDNAVTLSGGWNDGFTSRTSDPLATRISLSGQPNKSQSFYLSNGVLRFHGFTFEGANITGQNAPPVSAAVYASLLEFQNCVFRNNTVFGGPSWGRPSALGVSIRYPGSYLTIRDTQFLGNRSFAHSASPSHPAYGALGIWSDNNADGAQIELTRLLVSDNMIADQGASTIVGGALSLDVIAPNVRAVLTDIDARRNRVVIPGTGGHVTGTGLSIVASAPGAFVSIDRARLDGNTSPAAARGQFRAFVQGGHVELKNSLVARGSASGMALQVAAGGTFLADGVTVASHAGRSVSTSSDGSGVFLLANSLLASNGQNAAVGPAIVLDQVLETNVPGFVDPANGNYHLQQGSPAANAGVAAYNDRGEVDLSKAPRVKGPAVDLGAFEDQ
jgi:hypothetical protein